MGVTVVSEAPSDKRDKVASWLDPSCWPTPAWISKGVGYIGVKDFQAYYTHHLRTRYMELEGDFRTVVANHPPHDVPSGETIFGYLQAVRPALEQRGPDLLTVASTLDLVERYMVWLYPPHVFEVRRISTMMRLEELHPPGWQTYVDQLQPSGRNTDLLRMPLDEAIAVCNRHALNEGIASGLQIRRLKTYRNWSVLILLVLLILTPLLVSPQGGEFWPSTRLFDLGIVAFWQPAFSVLMVGMLGGFISGLFQISGSRVMLSDYQESMVKLSVRPMLGGLASLILFVLLSWSLIPAIKTDTAGSYLLVAFLSGFSERYLLRLIDPKASDDKAPPPEAPAATSTPMRSSPPTPVSTDNPR